jgi:hypothetical protein
MAVVKPSSKPKPNAGGKPAAKPASKVKQKSITSKTLLFNIGGAGLVLMAAVLAIKSSFTPKPETPSCETRYPGGVLFSLTRQGASPLASEDLQARLGGTDRGLIKNAKIVEDANVPQSHALEVALKRSTGEEDDQARSGIGFVWGPRQLGTASAACLAYSVWVPEDFKFGDGGVLPGLVSDGGGAAEVTAPSPQAGSEGTGPVRLPVFSTRPQWRSDGAILLWQNPNIGQPSGILIDPTKAGLKPGRWVRIEEEVVLNTPNRPDGVLRAWVDGKLMVERFDLGFRRDENQSFQAIIGDIHHTRYGGWAPAPADTRLRISPLELRLR